MLDNKIDINFLTLFSLITFFIFLLITKFGKKIKNGILLDTDYNKPQAFHIEATTRCGGLAVFISLIIFTILNNLFFSVLYIEYIILGGCLFLIGFLDDLKISISPRVRLTLMITSLLIFLPTFNFGLNQIDLIFLANWLENKIFLNFFLILCFLFIINGSNLIDGFNGLLGIQFLIINIFLLLINLENQKDNFTIFLVAQIITLLIFILFNFPKAKVFLGDGGAYLFGTLISINIIKTNNLNPDISSFFFCVILFYLFFEVFFSFFRKIFQNKSPLKPDGNHLHMLIYKFLKNRDISNCNYLTSIIINFVYTLIILPAFFLKTNGSFCKYWFILSLVFYFYIYRSINYKINNNENN